MRWGGSAGTLCRDRWEDRAVQRVKAKVWYSLDCCLCNETHGSRVVLK